MTEPDQEASVRLVAVDDSAAVLRLLERGVAQEPAMELVATAGNGRDVLALARRERPDVLILDLGLPGRSGAEVLASLHQHMPSLPVVIFSGLPRMDAGTVLDAIGSAAVQFVPKPSGTSALRPLAYLREELFPVVRMLAGRSEPPPRAAGKPPLRHPVPEHRPPRLVTVASSTGGPDALAELMSDLRPFPATAVLVVQHMAARFTTMLAQRLGLLAAAPVAEARHGQVIMPGEVLIAPGGLHLAVERRGQELVATLDRGPKVNYCRPSADVLFKSAASAAGARVLAVVLSGMGRDGADGSQAVVAAGGEVIAQSPETAVCPSMPTAVAHLATVMPVAAMAGVIRRRCARVGSP